MTEAEQVLSNWIRLAISPSGQFAVGTDPAIWVMENFLRWWQSQTVSEPLDAARRAAIRIREQLQRLGGSDNQDLGEAMEELTSLDEALAELDSTFHLK